MKFERFHQIFKNFAKNCNFINTAKSFSEKYVKKLQLEFSGLYEYNDHPIIQHDITVNRKNESIKSVTINGLKIKNLSETILMSQSFEMMQVTDIIEIENQIHFEGLQMSYQFNNEMLGYKVLEIEKETSIVPMSNIKCQVGHIFKLLSGDYVFFKSIF